MMNIDEGNLIVKNVIYQNMTNSIKIIKTFDEFGFYKYGIFTDSKEPGKYFIIYRCDNFCF